MESITTTGNESRDAGLEVRPRLEFLSFLSPIWSVWFSCHKMGTLVQMQLAVSLVYMVYLIHLVYLVSFVRLER
jgi:hypothetical protein